MIYSLRYTPEAKKDMDMVWEGVYEASKSFNIADKYVREFIYQQGRKPLNL